MNKMQALHSFWSSFSIKAYDATSVPDEATMPYITYEASSDNFGEQLSQTCSIWYRSSSWKEIQEKEAEISAYIGRGGRLVNYEGGAFWIRRGTPWSIRLAGEGDEYVRRMMLNVEVEFID